MAGIIPPEIVKQVRHAGDIVVVIVGQTGVRNLTKFEEELELR
jgi:hypothetical protein